MRQLFYAACFFEAGLLLLILPWTVFWDRNYVLELLPVVHAIAQSPYMRGAVSGLGVVNLAIGVQEVARMLSARFDGERRPSLAPRSDVR